MFQLAKATASSIWDEAAAVAVADGDDAAGKAKIGTARWWRQSESASRLEAMIKLSRSEPGISIAPDALDRNGFVLNCNNGTLDLRTGELLPHRRDDLITKLARVDYDPDAAAPRFDTFLSEVTGGDPELAIYIQRAAGFSLTGSTVEQHLFILHGSGNNGKSTFTETMATMLGDYATMAAPDLLVDRKHPGHPTEIMDLCGRRMIIAEEPEEGNRLRTGFVKMATGNERLKGRHLFKDFTAFSRTFKLWLCTNHKPVVRESNVAIWRRLKLIPFTLTVPADRVDKSLTTKLRNELPGILAWL